MRKTPRPKGFNVNSPGCNPAGVEQITQHYPTRRLELNFHSAVPSESPRPETLRRRRATNFDNAKERMRMCYHAMAIDAIYSNAQNPRPKGLNVNSPWVRPLGGVPGPADNECLNPAGVEQITQALPYTSSRIEFSFSSTVRVPETGDSAETAR